MRSSARPVAARARGCSASRTAKDACPLRHPMTWQATFAVLDALHPLARAATGRAELRISDALLEALRRESSRAEMGPHMPHVDEVYIRNDSEVARVGRNGFAREELGILENLNGRNSVKDVARKTRTGTFAVASILYRLDRARLVRRRRSPITTGPA